MLFNSILKKVLNYAEYLWDIDENLLQPNKEDVEILNYMYMKINNLQAHFEIFGIIGLIPVGSFILNCIRKNNLVIDLIAIKESNIYINDISLKQ